LSSKSSYSKTSKNKIKIRQVTERGNMDYKIRKICPEDNFALAELIRYNLKNHGLDIPGTVYFDDGLYNLYEFYSHSKKRGYYILTDESNLVLGGIGFAEFSSFKGCAELQKLYLADSVKGNGLGYRLINYVEEKMAEAGFKASYLETHSNLKAAIHIYEKSGYLKIDRPKHVAHGAMDNFYYKKLTKEIIGNKFGESL
jgi:putative acetyltransferase